MAALDVHGLAVITHVVSEDERARTRAAISRAIQGLSRDLGGDPLRLDPHGDLRLLMKYDAQFYAFLAYPQLHAILDRYLAPSAILRFQNGMCIRPGQYKTGAWHMNFRRVLNGYRASMESVFAIDEVPGPEFLFAAGTQQLGDAPASDRLEAIGAQVHIPAGAMLVFDGTLWHRQGTTAAASDIWLITQQFARHFFKPHIDYVRALGPDVVRGLSERPRRLLGWESRVPASLNEFYAPPEERVYLPVAD